MLSSFSSLKRRKLLWFFRRHRRWSLFKYKIFGIGILIIYILFENNNTEAFLRLKTEYTEDFVQLLSGHFCSAFSTWAKIRARQRYYQLMDSALHLPDAQTHPNLKEGSKDNQNVPFWSKMLSRTLWLFGKRPSPGRGYRLCSFMTQTVFERTQGVWCVQTYTGEEFFWTSNINAPSTYGRAKVCPIDEPKTAP